MSSAMPSRPVISAAQIGQFLDAAREIIAEVPICWLVTRSLEGGTSARAVKASPALPGSDEWSRRMLVRRSSRKVTEIRAVPLITLAFQHPSGERWVALGGRVRIVDDLAQVRSLWPQDRDGFFPPGFADAHMTVLETEADRIEIHVRGLTPEPFGAGRTLLERQPDGAWRFIPAW